MHQVQLLGFLQLPRSSCSGKSSKPALLRGKIYAEARGGRSLSGGFLLLDCPRLLLRCAAACWKRGRGASKGEPMVPIVSSVSDMQGLHQRKVCSQPPEMWI